MGFKEKWLEKRSELIDILKSDSQSIYSCFLKYFKPDVIKEDEAFIHTHDKRLLQKSIDIIRDRLTDPRIKELEEKLINELVSVYILCLNCLDKLCKDQAERMMFVRGSMYEFSATICASLLSLKKPFITKIINGIMDSFACHCKDEMNLYGMEFVAFVSYCANECQAAGTNICCTIAENLLDISESFTQAMKPIDLIVKLYANALIIKSYCGKTSNNNTEDERDERARRLLNDGESAGLLELLRTYLLLCYQKKLVSSVECVGSTKYKEQEEEEYRVDYMMLSCLNALNFFCMPLAEAAKLGKIADTERDAFYMICECFNSCEVLNTLPSLCSYTFAEEINVLELLLSVALVAVSLSTASEPKMKESVHVIQQSVHVMQHSTISSKWISTGRMYLFDRLRRIVCCLDNNNHLNKALEAIQLCCEDSREYVLLLCKLFREKSRGSHFNDVELKRTVNEMCSDSIRLLRVLYQFGYQNVQDRLQLEIVEVVEIWSNAARLFPKLSAPKLLVEEWVQITMKRNAVGAEDGDQTLSNLLASSKQVTKQARGIILAQELCVYEDLQALHPEFCNEMKKKIFETLSDDLETTKEGFFLLIENKSTQNECLQISRILIRKGWAYKDDQYFSKAITILNGETGSSSTHFFHQLAVAHCLRALCTQEVKPNSKQLMQDIDTAVELWLRILNQVPSDDCNIFTEITLLLYNIVDLLSLKGFLESRPLIYELLIRLFKHKAISLGNCLAILWESKRLGHALCASPVSEAFIKKLATVQCLESSTSVDFWIKELQSSLVGLEQTFLLIIDDVKKAASALDLSVSQSSCSVFHVGSLYYDLCQKFILNGHLIKALSYAKKALKLRFTVFEEKFLYSDEMWPGRNDAAGDTTHKHPDDFLLRVIPRVAREVWSFNDESWKVDSYLSPWNVLKCYLESILQVGLIYELLGDGDTAESHLVMGKKISCCQGLPIFEVVFSSVLGKIYHRMRYWNLAKRELKAAENILKENNTEFSCIKCKLMLVATVELHLGDLSFDSKKELSQAEKHFNNALENLNHSEWISCPEEADSDSILHGQDFVVTKCGTCNQSGTMKLLTREKPNAAMEGKKCICNKLKCWQCLPAEVTKSKSVDSLIYMKWELVRRQLSLEVLNRLGKCKEYLIEIHEEQGIILKSVSFLIDRNTISHTYASVSSNSFLDLIGKQFPGDVFAVERAVVLYNICWFTLKGYNLKGNRDGCCDLWHIDLDKIVHLLKLAFVLCREVPIISQKVSRLLAVMYILSASSKHFSLSSPCILSKSQWASFFHQASLGTHLNYRFLSSPRFEGSELLDSEKSHASGSSDNGNLLRIAPESIEVLDQFVQAFFKGLPSPNIICISLLGDGFSTLLKDLLRDVSRVDGWIFLSRLNLKSQPTVILLPAKTVEVSNDDTEGLRESKGPEWCCPWVYSSTVVDKVAPSFKQILEEAHSARSTAKTLREAHRLKLDNRLSLFLSKLEDLWLGPWKYMLLGKCSNQKPVDLHSILMKLSQNCKVDVNENLLRVFRGCLDDGRKVEEYAQLGLNKGCYIGTVRSNDEDECSTTPANVLNRVEKFSDSADLLIQEAVEKMEEDSVNREPTVLVLDCEIQMLPWENIPILRNEEVYRMPSVGSISATLGTKIPFIDLSDAFFFLDPAPDIQSSGVALEKMFRSMKLQGFVGSVPTAKTLVESLNRHDLFIYLGHGSGVQYIPDLNLQKLTKCGAILLMGCSSGTLDLQGPYIPKGTPLSYLQCGSPFVIANLWDVTTDISRFGFNIVAAWCKESRPAGRNQRPKFVGSFMGQARKECNYPFLNGASAVCYGVPTRLQRKYCGPLFRK